MEGIEWKEIKGRKLEMGRKGKEWNEKRKGKGKENRNEK